MGRLVANYIALGVFLFVVFAEDLGVVETPEVRQQREAASLESASKAQAEAEERERQHEAIAAARREQEELAAQQFRTKQQTKDDILAACQAAMKLPKTERNQRAEEILQEMYQQVEAWGEERDDIDWMQSIKTQWIRRLLQ